MPQHNALLYFVYFRLDFDIFCYQFKFIVQSWLFIEFKRIRLNKTARYCLRYGNLNGELEKEP